MVDFTKLRDPVWIAEQASKRKVVEEDAKVLGGLVKNAIDRCERAFWALEKNELNFVKSCANHVFVNSRQLTDKQLKWLGDIEHRVDGRLGFIYVSHAMRGYIAVHMATNADSEGDFNPQQTGIGSHATAELAAKEAKTWAESEGIRFEGVDSANQGPVLLKDFLDLRAKKVQVEVSSPSQCVQDGAVVSSAGPNGGVSKILAARARATPVAAGIPSASSGVEAIQKRSSRRP